MDEYYNKIKNELINNEIVHKIKDYSKNKSDLSTYYNVGKILSEAGKHYGEGIIKKYSNKLTNELKENYNVTKLKKIRKFYFIIEKGATLSHQLPISLYFELLSLHSINEINYYINCCIKQNISVRDLRNRIKNKEYERLDDKSKLKIINNEKLYIDDSIKNPIVIYNKNYYVEISEKVLQKIILEDIESFMKELGESYSFIGSEYKIKIGNNYNYIDLLLFNIKYNCYVVVELKITELKKEHIGQIETYMNYIDKNVKNINQNNTIGIIICKKDNKYIIEYCSDKRIISREYLLIQ